MRSVLLAQSVVLAVAGLALFGWPTQAAAYWPWTLTPLAARFVGSSFIAISVGMLLTARRPSAGAILAVAATDVGLLLQPLSGILGPAPELVGPRQLGLGAAATALAIAGLGLAVAVLRAGYGRRSRSDEAPLPRALLAFFAVHLVLVALVGGSMFLAPAAVRERWPWQLSVVNVRLVGSIFVGSIALSILALRSRGWTAVLPTLGTYATFTALALVAVAVHFALFNPARPVTWVFLALYAIVAATSVVALVLAPTAGVEPAPEDGAGGVASERDDRRAAAAGGAPGDRAD